MTNRRKAQAEPVVLPDVATGPHPVPHLPVDAGEGVLQDALPEIAEAARKVGGFKKLAEIVGQLERNEPG
jgi:hypothetical protein